MVYLVYSCITGEGRAGFFREGAEGEGIFSTFLGRLHE